MKNFLSALFHTVAWLLISLSAVIIVNAQEEAPVDYISLGLSLSEILPNPVGSDADGEFIELYNSGSDEVDLTGWHVESESSSGSISTSELVGMISSEEFFVLARASGDFSFSLTNSTLTLRLVAPDDIVIDEIIYDGAEEGRAWSTVDDVWQWSDPTPAAENIADVIEVVDEENFEDVLFPQILINEIFPDPSENDEEKEFVELFNSSDEEVDLHGWTLRDSSKSGSYVFEDGAVIAPHGFYSVYREIFGFALNNSGEESVTLLNPKGWSSDSVAYEDAQEDFSYSRDSDENFRWTRHVTLDAHNVFDAPPDISFDIPDEAFRNVPAEFSTQVKNADDADVNIVWDFGDGSKSTKSQMFHAYAEKGAIEGSVTIRIGGEEIVENFSLKIKKYPRKKVDIVSIMPNPEGADTDEEWVMIQNNESKKIKLDGWKIAAGASKYRLAGRAIDKEGITLKSGESMRLTYEHVPFSLPNARGNVELRYPDDSVASSVTYESSKTIKEGAQYRRRGDAWVWDIPMESIEDGNSDDQSVDDVAREVILQALMNESTASNDEYVSDDDDEEFVQEDAPRIIERPTWIGRVVGFFGILWSTAF